MERLISCPTHGAAPWGVVCAHLADGVSHNWRPVPQDPGTECENDWLCPECSARVPAPPAGSLRLVCMF